MKISIAQQNYHIGNFEENTEKILGAIELAKKEGADLILFSEMSVCGYPARDFVEFEEVYTDQFYGTLKSEVNRVWSQGKTVIFDVDVVGGLNLKKEFGDNAMAVFVQPPSFEELESRLRGRSTETEDKIRQRMEKAAKELAFAEEFDHILVNDNLLDAFKKAEELVKQFLS